MMKKRIRPAWLWLGGIAAWQMYAWIAILPRVGPHTGPMTELLHLISCPFAWGICGVIGFHGARRKQWLLFVCAVAVAALTWYVAMLIGAAGACPECG